jgi:hypothetical protein
MEEIDQISLHPTKKHSETDMYRPCISDGHFTKKLASQIFGNSTWLPQCMALIHSARYESSNVGSPDRQDKLAVAFTFSRKSTLCT